MLLCHHWLLICSLQLMSLTRVEKARGRTKVSFLAGTRAVGTLTTLSSVDVDLVLLVRSHGNDLVGGDDHQLMLIALSLSMLLLCCRPHAHSPPQVLSLYSVRL